MRGRMKSSKNAQWGNAVKKVTNKWHMLQQSQLDLKDMGGAGPNLSNFSDKMWPGAWPLMEKRSKTSFFLFLETSTRTLLCIKQILAVYGNFFSLVKKGA